MTATTSYELIRLARAAFEAGFISAQSDVHTETETASAEFISNLKDKLMDLEHPSQKAIPFHVIDCVFECITELERDARF